MSKSLRLFLSYRRDDMGGIASAMVGRLYDRLSEHYGNENVFMDVDTIPPGVPFDSYLSDAVSKADVLLAVVGDQWVELLRSRAHESNDFVRIEVEAAMKQSIPVVPLLVGGTEMPTREELPDTLSDFVRHNAYPIDAGRDFNAHVTRLVNDLDRHFGPETPPGSGAPKRTRRKRLLPVAIGLGTVLALAGSASFILLQNEETRLRLMGQIKSLYQDESITGTQEVPSSNSALPSSPPDVTSEEDSKAALSTLPEEDFTNHLAMKMVWCPPGEFLMGSPTGEEGRNIEETRHTVSLSQGFWIASHEITQQTWEKVMGDNPSFFLISGPTAPVEQVSWSDAKKFCDLLTQASQEQREIPPEYSYTLPTEAEWEYSCRAGSSGPWNQSSIPPDKLGWFAANSEHQTRPVGEKLPNAWGIHDMHGNVFEWCLDGKAPYPASSVTNPQGATHAEHRIFRGGGWSSGFEFCRSAYRFGYKPDFKADFLGFRPVLKQPPSKS